MDSSPRQRSVTRNPPPTDSKQSPFHMTHTQANNMSNSSCKTTQKWLIFLTTVVSLLSFVLLWNHLGKTDHLEYQIKIVGGQLFKVSPSGKQSLVAAPEFRDQLFVPNFSQQSDQEPTIPHIIHQIWDSHDIQGFYHKWVQSWLHKNPDWQYWIWTIDDGHMLIEKFFPDFLTLFESYPSTIYRADAMRYFIIYQYGGIYLDLDMECLQPLDNWTYGYNCFVSEEPYVHSYIIRNQNVSNIVNGILGCGTKHPFYKMVINSLNEYAGKYFGDFLYATGPFFLEEVYKKYHQTTNNLSSAVTILPPKYFLPTFDPSEGDVISHKCLPAQVKELSIAAQSVCRHLMVTSYKNKPGQEAFADHLWVHANMFGNEWKKQNAKSIFELVPKAKNVTHMLNTE